MNPRVTSNWPDLTDEELWVLDMLEEFGPCHFSVASDLIASNVLLKRGYIYALPSGAMEITEKGRMAKKAYIAQEQEM